MPKGTGTITKEPKGKSFRYTPPVDPEPLDFNCAIPKCNCTEVRKTKCPRNGKTCNGHVKWTGNSQDYYFTCSDPACDWQCGGLNPKPRKKVKKSLRPKGAKNGN